MKKEIFKGCATAIITPFTNNGVNLEVFEELVLNQINNGVDALVVCGTTGEASTMSDDEKISVIKSAVKVSAGRVPILVGTGSNSTSKVIEFNKKIESLGVDGLLIVTPYYNKTTQDGLIVHYKLIAQSTDLPILLYNVPSRTGVNILPSGNISQIAEIAHLCNDDFSIYSGNDSEILPILSLGGKGVISVVSHYNPKLVHDLCYNFFKGNLEDARKIQLDLLPLINILFSEVNPIPVKAMMNELGYNVGVPRLPLIKMSDAGVKKLRKVLTDMI